VGKGNISEFQTVSRGRIRSMQYTLFEQMTVAFGLDEESEAEIKDQPASQEAKPHKKKERIWKKIKVSA
jgi:hypothetical protein